MLEDKGQHALDVIHGQAQPSLRTEASTHKLPEKPEYVQLVMSIRRHEAGIEMWMVPLPTRCWPSLTLRATL
jgi:hypothetical protein